MEKKTKFNRYLLNKPKVDKENKVRLSGQSESILAKKGLRKEQNLSQNGPIRRSVIRSSLNKTIKMEEVNSNLSKTMVQKMKRMNTEGNQKGNLQTLKLYIKNITKACNVLDQRLTETCEYPDPRLAEEKREETKKYMMAHLSFAEIEEEKINNQKSIMKKMKESLKNTSKMISIKSTNYACRKSEQYILLSLKNIDKIYKVLFEMSEMGYSSRNNKYLINFCANVRFWMAKLFLIESKDKKDAFCLTTKYLVVNSAEEVKDRLSDYLMNEEQADLGALTHDIEELLDHMETTLSQKKIQEVSKIETYVGSRLKYHRQKGNYDWQELRIPDCSPERFNFSKNIAQLEEKYGPMREISKVSRNRFEDLNQTLVRLQQLV